ncbi:helix-turn-helix domain-containing protein [Aeromonas caviae]|uniref:helix-turn-helix domain-containing protein n=1 Tax=Aeromonas caviae TaxID=648 RepID=UPI0038CFC989
MQRIPIKFAHGVLRQAFRAGLSQRDIRRDIYSEYEFPGVSDMSLNSFYSLIHNAENVGVNILAAYHNTANLLQGMMSLMPLQTLSELNSACMLSGLKKNVTKSGITETNILEIKQLSENELKIQYNAPTLQLQNSIFIPMGGFLVLKSLVEYYLQGTGEQAEIRFDLSSGKTPDHERDLLDRLKLDCRMKQAHSAMYIRTPLLQTPFRYFNPVLSSIGAGEMSPRVAVAVDEKTSILQQVKTLLKNFYWSEEKFGERCDLEFVAQRLEIPTWTLKRRLAAKNSTFLVLHQEVIFERACELLRDPRLSLDVVSNKLGFASQSSMTRFFKQCSGVSPLKFRRQQS